MQRKQFLDLRQGRITNIGMKDGSTGPLLSHQVHGFCINNKYSFVHPLISGVINMGPSFSKERMQEVMNLPCNVTESIIASNFTSVVKECFKCNVTLTSLFP